MTDTFRALCVEVLAFNNGEGCYNFSSLKPSDRDNAAFDAWQDIRQRLKSALAQPEPKEPGPVDYRRWHEAHSEDCNTWSEQPTAPLTLRTTVEALNWANYCLARWGRPAIRPVPVSEPGTADHITDDEGRRWDRTMDAALWAKAFCLICPEMTSREGLMIGWFANAIMAGCDHQAWKMDAEREPVPVGERLPGLEDCDTRGRCWFIDDDEKWCPVILGDILDEDEPDAIQRVICYYGYTHWLQGWALPVPTSQESP